MGAKCVKQSKISVNKDLEFAARYGLDTWIDDLVKEGADVNSRNSRGATPLILATTGKHTKSIELLIKHRADVNVVVEDWYYRYDPTVLHQAAKEESGKCMELLIAAGADVNVGANHMSPLIASSSVNNIVCAKLLLKAGALVNLTSKNAINATQCCIIRYGNGKKTQEFLRLLFAAGETTQKNFRYCDIIINIPKCLKELMEPDHIRLDDICRREIRKHLLKLSRNENLFVRIRR